MKQFWKLAVVTGAVIALCAGCKSKEILVEEVLQIPEQTPVYTAYNIWYVNPDQVPSLNILYGKILPFGTEVKVLSVNEEEVSFETVAGHQKFRILYNQQERLIPMESFLKTLFTTRNRDELAEGIRPLVFEKIRRGIVERGMIRREVELAYGLPAAFRTPDLNSDTWVYWTGRMISRRVIFFDGKVIQLLEI